MDYNKVEEVRIHSRLLSYDLDKKVKKKYGEYIRNHSDYFIIGKLV